MTLGRLAAPGCKVSPARPFQLQMQRLVASLFCLATVLVVATRADAQSTAAEGSGTVPAATTPGPAAGPSAPPAGHGHHTVSRAHFLGLHYDQGTTSAFGASYVHAWETATQDGAIWGQRAAQTGHGLRRHRHAAEPVHRLLISKAYPDAKEAFVRRIGDTCGVAESNTPRRAAMTPPREAFVSPREQRMFLPRVASASHEASMPTREARSPLREALMPLRQAETILPEAPAPRSESGAPLQEDCAPLPEDQRLYKRHVCHCEWQARLCKRHECLCRRRE
jgi:hypothetical protein